LSWKVEVIKFVVKKELIHLNCCKLVLQTNMNGIDMNGKQNIAENRVC